MRARARLIPRLYSQLCSLAAVVPGPTSPNLPCLLHRPAACPLQGQLVARLLELVPAKAGRRIVYQQKEEDGAAPAATAEASA